MLYCLISLITAFSWFQSRLNHQTRPAISNSPTTHHSTLRVQPAAVRQQSYVRTFTNAQRQTLINSNRKSSANYTPLQRILNQRLSQLRNTTAVHRQANSHTIQNKQIIQQNRFRTMGYQQRNRSLNNPIGFRRATIRTNNNTNNRIANSRFRALFRTGKNNNTNVRLASRRTVPQSLVSRKAVTISKSNNSVVHQKDIQLRRFHSIPVRGNIRNTKTSSLVRSLTTKILGNTNRPNEQRILTNPYAQQRWERFHQLGSTRTPIKSVVKQRKRRDQLDDVPSEAFKSMVLVRDSPSIDININSDQ